MKPTPQHLQTINSRLPAGAEKLKADQVEVLPFRVFDSNMTDRHTVMSPEMMNKLVLDLNMGKVAFNSLHQSQSTLPVGASINGCVVNKRQHSGKMGKEVHANMFAIVKNPDGTPATDGQLIANKYNTGAVRACSAGVQVGLYECSVCGNDIRDYNKCEHIPGRTYTKNEKPVQCFATMTGKNIQDGIAMDCGAYELSAVTAGGVANAGVLTESFGKYEEGADVAEFKKSAFDEQSKPLESRILFTACLDEHQPQEDNNMELQDRYDALVRENAQQGAEYKLLQTQFANLEAQLKNLTESYAVTTAKVTELTATVETLQAANAAFTTLSSELDAYKAIGAVDVLVASKETGAAFEAAYRAHVETNRNKLGLTEDLATFTLEALQAKDGEYTAKINLLPSGRQTVDGINPDATYQIPADSFVITK